MPIDNLPANFIVPTRNELRDQALRDWVFRVPDADTGADTDPFVICSNLADGLSPAYANTLLAYARLDINNATGTALDAWGRRLDGGSGELDRRGVTLSTGFATVVAASGGGNINELSELKHTPSGQKFETVLTGVYQNGQALGIRAKARGPTGNLPAGSKLSFTTVPPGIAQDALVLADSAGRGLIGGAPPEDDDAYRKRLLIAIQEPPASGNEAEVIRVLSSVRELPIQGAFCFPAIFGPGTYGWAVLMIPAAPGDSRVPNAAQLALLEAALKDAFPGDDGIVGAAGAEDGFRFVIEVTWKSGAASWIDEATWPPLVSTPVTVSGAVAPSVAAVRVTSSVAYAAPTVGKTIGFYDPVTKTFARKRILTVSFVAANVYDLTFDMTTLNASDQAFVPIIGSVVSPWSDSLTDVVLPLINYVDLQGYGEQVATFDDPGRRQRRFPPPTPDFFPSKIENRAIDGLFVVVEDAEIVEPSVPLATAIGTPGVLCYVHQLTDIGVFPQ